MVRVNLEAAEFTAAVWCCVYYCRVKPKFVSLRGKSATYANSAYCHLLFRSSGDFQD